MLTAFSHAEPADKVTFEDVKLDKSVMSAATAGVIKYLSYM
jgi:hypothetical protein